MWSDGGPRAAASRAACSRWIPLAVPILLSTVGGCRPAPQVPAANLVYSAALRTAANTRDSRRLETVRQRIDRDHAAGLITADEYSHYTAILAAADAGRWNEAEQAALRFRRSQLR